MFNSQARSTLVSGLIHGAAIFAILAVTGVKPSLIRGPVKLFLPADLTEYRPKPVAKSGVMQGGGGMRENRPASYGQLPHTSLHPFVPPTTHAENPAPIISIEPAIFGTPDPHATPLDISLIGSPTGVHGPPSNGPGKCCGIGDGEGYGVGNRKGDGYEDGDVIGGEARIGTGSVVSPVLLYKTEPEYSEEARKAKLQGTVVLRIEVNTRGQAQNISVRQGLGLGLEDQAMKAVRNWKFKPGTVNGKPATVVAFVEVTFRLL